MPPQKKVKGGMEITMISIPPLAVHKNCPKWSGTKAKVDLWKLSSDPGSQLLFPEKKATKINLICALVCLGFWVFAVASNQTRVSIWLNYNERNHGEPCTPEKLLEADYEADAHFIRETTVIMFDH